MVLRHALPAPTRLVLALAVVLPFWACESSSKTSGTAKTPVDRSASQDAPSTAEAPVVRRLEVVSHVGGTHYRTIVHNGRWFQTFSNVLMVLDREKGTIEAKRTLSEFGSTGPAVDMAAVGDRGVAVLDRDAVIEIGADSGDLIIRDTVDHVALGFRPRRASVSGGEIWIGGEGGVMRWSDRKLFLSSGVDGPIGAVAASGKGPVACAGRRVYEVFTGNFVAAATDLLELPAGVGAPLAYALQGKESFSVGLMGPDLRELSRTVINGTCRRLRWFDNRLWCVTDAGIHSWKVEGDRLVDQRTIRVKGARDVDMLGPNRLAIAGSFGRAMYRPEPQGRLRGDEFLSAVREASRLEKAIADGRRILAGSDAEGFWLYLIGADAELTDREMTSYKQPIQSVRGVWGRAEIVEGAKKVKGTVDGIDHEYAPEGDPDIYCLAAVDDCLWIGHSFGVDVVGGLSKGTLTRIGTLRLDGPVRYIEPKWDRGAAFVAEFGGFGVAQVRTDTVVQGEIVDRDAIGGGKSNAPPTKAPPRNRPPRPGDGD